MKWQCKAGAPASACGLQNQLVMSLTAAFINHVQLQGRLAVLQAFVNLASESNKLPRALFSYRQVTQMQSLSTPYQWS